MSNAELFVLVFIPLQLVLFMLGRIYHSLEKIAKNTEKEGEQK